MWKIVKNKGSALALALVFSFVGILITVAYLEYLQIASKQTKTSGGTDYARVIAKVGIQKQFHRLQRLYFRYEQAYLEGEVMGGSYRLISRAYYDMGIRNLEITAIGQYGEREVAVSKLFKVNTPTDYVRFFDGNYMNLLGDTNLFINQGGATLPSLFWLGPVHSNGSIALGMWDFGYPHSPEELSDYKAHGGIEPGYYQRISDKQAVNWTSNDPVVSYAGTSVYYLLAHHWMYCNPYLSVYSKRKYRGITNDVAMEVRF